MTKTPTPRLSIIVPTRERAAYLPHALATCLANPEPDLEILVLDNASVDGTRAAVEAIRDPRLRYERSETRLSMRDNFERGLDLARGEVIGFIGDDDGVLGFTAARVNAVMADPAIDAVSARKIHYGWPDLVTRPANIALVPRGRGMRVQRSAAGLRRLLDHKDYFLLPCLYHAFVRRSVVARLRARHGRLFLSSQIDMFSSIVLSREDLNYALLDDPIVINGGSARSNGASQAGVAPSAETVLFKKEDDVGFLPGFADPADVGSLIVESGARYCAANGIARLDELFDHAGIVRAIAHELGLRAARGRADAGEDAAGKMAAAANVDVGEVLAFRAEPPASDIARRVRHFAAMRPILATRHDITNVAELARLLTPMIAGRRTGFLDDPADQLAAVAHYL